MTRTSKAAVALMALFAALLGLIAPGSATKPMEASEPAWETLPAYASIRPESESITRIFAGVAWSQASPESPDDVRVQSLDAWRLIAIMGSSTPRALLAMEGSAIRSAIEGDSIADGVRLTKILVNQVELTNQAGCKRIIALPAPATGHPTTECPEDAE